MWLDTARVEIFLEILKPKAISLSFTLMSSFHLKSILVYMEFQSDFFKKRLKSTKDRLRNA